MSKKKIKPVDLSATVDKLLAEYGDEVFDVLGTAIKETSEEAVQDLRSVNSFSSSGRHSGDYSNSWTYKEQYVKRMQKEMIVYNEEHYRLTHLLESGHAKWLWGRSTGERVQAFPHIAPVNDKAQETVVRKVEEAISKI